MNLGIEGHLVSETTDLLIVDLSLATHNNTLRVS